MRTVKHKARLPRIFAALLVVSAILVSSLAPMAQVYAAASTNKLSVSFRDNSLGLGIVQYSLNDGANWADITENVSDQTIAVTGDNLKLKLVPNEGYAVDYAGIELSVDGGAPQLITAEQGFETEGGYVVDAQAVSVVLNNVEFHSDESQDQGDPNTGTQEYNLTSNGVSLTFTDEANHDYEAMVIDVLKMTEQERAALDVSEEEYNTLLDLIKSKVAKYGTLLSIYAIEVNSSSRSYHGEAVAQLPLTKEMQKYDTFKMLYLDEENNFQVGEAALFKAKGNVIKGTLPHLSVYALVGSNTSNGTTNPNTMDNVSTIIAASIISIIGLIGGVFYLKK